MSWIGETPAHMLGARRKHMEVDFYYRGQENRALPAGDPEAAEQQQQQQQQQPLDEPLPEHWRYCKAVRATRRSQNKTSAAATAAEAAKAAAAAFRNI